MDRTRNAPTSIVLATLAATALALPASAVDRTWTNPNGGSFYGMTNWSPLGWPVAGDTAIFDMTIANTVIMGFATTTNRRLVVPGGELTLDLNGQLYELTTLDLVEPSFVVGDDGATATLTLRSGQISSIYSDVADHASSSGLVEVSGADWTSNGTLKVGNLGEGTVDVINGSSLTTLAGTSIGNLVGSAGTMRVGDGSTWTSWQGLFVGGAGAGALTVDTAATASIDSMTLAVGATSTGTVAVTGIGASLDATALVNVGAAGPGELQVDGGATITSDSAVLGDTVTGDGQARVGNPGSTWTNAGGMAVGLGGVGGLTVFDGGAVSTAFLVGGLDSGSSGTVTVTSGGTLTVASTLRVGADGTGSMVIDGGGSVSSVNLATIGDGAGSVGQVTIDGGLWSNAGQVDVGDMGQGTLRLLNWGSLVAGGVFVNAMSRIEGDGVIEAPVTSSGAISPGQSAGRLIIEGSFFVQDSSGVLEIEIGGRDPASQHDVLEIPAGQAMLAGTLEVTLIDGFVPTVGDAFDVVTASLVAGPFDAMNLPALPPGSRWSVTTAGTHVRLEVLATCLTDCAQPPDGAVDVVDLLALLASWGQASPCDSDGSGPIDVVDLLALLADWGGCP